MLSRKSRPAGAQTSYEWVTGDLTTGAGLDRALEGVSAVVHCATRGPRADVAMTRLLTEAAGRQALRPHLIYISIVGIDRISFGYYRAKSESERLIQRSGLPWTVLRATQFHDLIAKITEVQRRMPVTLALAGARFQPIDVREVADRLAALATGEPAGRVPDMGGPQVRSHTDLTRLCLRAAGRRRPVVPLWLPGGMVKGLRQGANLVPYRAVGRITFEEFLAGS
jgi:uncharacterized protein YbjT (DUF2867 family)